MAASSPNPRPPKAWLVQREVAFGKIDGAKAEPAAGEEIGIRAAALFQHKFVLMLREAMKRNTKGRVLSSSEERYFEDAQTQAELARLIGVNAATLGDHIRGTSYMKLSEMFNIAAALKIDIFELIPQIDERFLEPPA